LIFNLIRHGIKKKRLINNWEWILI
jgi:hypothetical protein